MSRYRIAKVLKIVAIVIVAVSLFGLVTEHLWNWLLPGIFGLPRIGFVQALGLVVLSKILFGGFHRHSVGHRGREWKQRMTERWMEMGPDERERFLAGMRGWRGCRWTPPRESVSEQKPA